MIWKLLIKLLGDRIYTPDKQDVGKLENWLSDNFKHRGWMSYYSMRKKSLMTLLGNGIEGKEYWETVGRLKELRSLSGNILTAYEKLAKKNKSGV